MNLRNLKVILILQSLNYADCVPFSCILSILFTIEQSNFQKCYTRISEKQDQTSTNLTNVLNFIE